MLTRFRPAVLVLSCLVLVGAPHRLPEAARGDGGLGSGPRRRPRRLRRRPRPQRLLPPPAPPRRPRHPRRRRSPWLRPRPPRPRRRRPPAEFMPNAALKDVYFDFDKSNIRPGDAKILDASATYLKANPNQLVLIEGHCDERGTAEYNLALGERRAKAAMNYLVAQGIDASRFTLISYGKERPVCTEKTEACWAAEPP